MVPSMKEKNSSPSLEKKTKYNARNQGKWKREAGIQEDKEMRQVPIQG